MKISVSVLLAALLGTMPSAARTLRASSMAGAQGLVLQGGDTLLLQRGVLFDGCLEVCQDDVVISCTSEKKLPRPVLTCSDTRSGYGNCIVLKGSGITVEGLRFENTLSRIPADHPRIGSFETMWMLGAVRIDSGAVNCTVRDCEFSGCAVGIKSNGEYSVIEGNVLRGPSAVLREWNWGPIGIWLSADHQTVRFNVIEGFRAEDERIPWKTVGPLGADGGAIEIDDARVPKHDIDIHHNFSSDNQGFLEVTSKDVAAEPDYSGFRIHENFSDDYQSFVLLWWGTDCVFEDNVILRRKVNGNEQAVFRFTQPGSSNVVRNNTIITAPQVRLFKNAATAATKMENCTHHVENQ